MQCYLATMLSSIFELLLCDCIICMCDMTSNYNFPQRCYNILCLLGNVYNKVTGTFVLTALTTRNAPDKIPYTTTSHSKSAPTALTLICQSRDVTSGLGKGQAESFRLWPRLAEPGRMEPDCPHCDGLLMVVLVLIIIIIFFFLWKRG